MQETQGAQTSDFRDFIRRAYRARLQRNPGYSLRKFASDIAVSPQKLNAILKRGAGLSSQSAVEIAAKLEMSPQDKELFCALVDAHHHRSPELRREAQEKLRALQAQSSLEEISPSDFSLISDWYFLACYLLVDVDDFAPDMQWVSNRLQIPVAQAQAAYDRLFSLGLLRVEDNKWVRDSAKFNVSSDENSPEMQKYYRQLLHKSMEKLETETVKTRHFSGTIFSVNEDDIEFAKREIDKFRKGFVASLAERGGNSERVFALNLQLFPLDRTDTLQGRA